MSDIIFDDRPCDLGEGPFWHPKRKQMFWFDITRCQLLTRTDNGPHHWDFDEEHSAAGWIDHDTLLIASARGLWRFSLTDGSKTLLTPLERDNTVTRSNDGRTDPWGGFWIGTMGRQMEPGAGAIYRLYQGQLRQLVSGITVSNAICFDPKRAFAYYTDTVTQQVMRVALDRTGWPDGTAEVLIDLTGDGLFPDGTVTDADGNLWVAQWGASRVACYSPAGVFQRAVEVPALQSSCPAFGGDALRDLYVTSARGGLKPETLAKHPANGMTFRIPDVAQGLPDYQVRL